MGYADRMTFDVFLKRLKTDLFEEKKWFVGPQTDYIYNKQGQQLVDYIGRFEELQSAFEHILSKLNLPLRPLPHVNITAQKASYKSNVFKRRLASLVKPGLVSASKIHKNYRDHYTPASIEIVAELYQSDINKFNYDFSKI